jgi:hypothetical protein
MSKTLSCLLKHWTDKDDDSLFCSAFEGDYGSLELPFNVEEFCRDMDKAIADAKRETAEKCAEVFMSFYHGHGGVAGDCFLAIKEAASER